MQGGNRLMSPPSLRATGIPTWRTVDDCRSSSHRFPSWEVNPGGFGELSEIKNKKNKSPLVTDRVFPVFFHRTWDYGSPQCALRVENVRGQRTIQLVPELSRRRAGWLEYELGWRLINRPSALVPEQPDSCPEPPENRASTDCYDIGRTLASA